MGEGGRVENALGRGELRGNRGCSGTQLLGLQTGPPGGGWLRYINATEVQDRKIVRAPHGQSHARALDTHIGTVAALTGEKPTLGLLPSPVHWVDAEV